MRATTLAFPLFLVLAAGASAQTIKSVKPDSAAANFPVKIEGTGFGATAGTVTVDGKEVKPAEWKDTSIIFTIPPDAKLGHVAIVVMLPGGSSSDSHDFVVTPQYDQSTFEVLTGVGAVLAGVEATSYKTDNDAFSAKNVGRKTPEILLGGGFILPWRAGGGRIEKAYCGSPNGQTPTSDCQPGGAYYHYRPWETFLSIRFAPTTDQTINGFVVGGGYRITKYFSLLIGYSVTPVSEPSPGFRVAAAQIVSANPTVSPYNRYNSSDLLNNKPGAFDGFPLFIYDANGVTTKKLFLSSPTVDHHRSGIYFGVGIPLNLTALFKPAAK